MNFIQTSLSWQLFIHKKLAVRMYVNLRKVGSDNRSKKILKGYLSSHLKILLSSHNTGYYYFTTSKAKNLKRILSNYNRTALYMPIFTIVYYTIVYQSKYSKHFA